MIKVVTFFETQCTVLTCHPMFIFIVRESRGFDEFFCGQFQLCRQVNASVLTTYASAKLQYVNL